jgi:hypothetical protein
VPDLTRIRHLVRRTLVSLRGREPSAGDDAWARSLLSPAEADLWEQMTPVDRAHAVEVARAVEQAGPPVVVAGLLHDVGKVESSLGVPGRVVATLVRPVVPVSWRPRLGAVGRHLDYEERGARLLAAAGSDPFVVAWAREHHLPPGRWSVDAEVGALLRAADDRAG